MNDQERKTSLARHVADASRSGWRVESQSDYQAVIVKGKRPNHILHLLLTIFTLGLWAIVWIVLAIASHERRKVLSVDESGNVSR